MASLGIHSVIAQYNGFYTLDGYYSNYPLGYKHAFRRIIASELNRHHDLKHYFDNWGSRIYLFASELREPGKLVTHRPDRDPELMNRAGNDSEVRRLELDYNAFLAQSKRINGC